MSKKPIILTKIQILLMLLESRHSINDIKDLKNTLNTVEVIVQNIKSLVEDEC